MKTLLLIGLGLAILLITVFFETAQDYWMAKDSMGKIIAKSKWKFYGNAQVWAYLAVLTTLDILLTDLYGLLLFPILGFIFWISHDATLGVRFKIYMEGNLTNKKYGIYYLSDEGFDKWFKAVCVGSGVVAFWIRVFWLALLIITYLSL
jgi:hypothetical protein